MQADDVLRATAERRDAIDVEARRVGCQYCTVLGDFAETPKHVFLDIHALENRLDDQVAIRQVFVVERCRENRFQPLRLVLGQETFLDTGREIPADRLQPLVQGLLLLVDQDRRDRRTQEAHGNSGAHQACADNADFPDGPSFYIDADTRHVAELSHGYAKVLLGIQVGHFRDSSSYSAATQSSSGRRCARSGGPQERHYKRIVDLANALC